MEFNFCRRCGSKLKNITDGYWKCANEHSTFSNPSPTTGVFFLDGNDVVVSRRGIEPDIGKLDSFGGFVNAHESAEEGMIREIFEQTGLSPNDYTDLEFFCTAPGIYSFEGEDIPVLSTFFISHLRPDAKLVANDDVSEIVRIPLTDIDSSEFRGEDVKIAVEKLRRIVGEKRV